MLVVPQHNPLALANSLASLDALSGGRLTIGAGVGWSEAEFAALGQSFADRGRRMDEMLDVLRACWGPDPVDFDGEFVHLDAMKVQPKPAHAIPIWVGGRSEPAYRRAAERGDGFHAIGLDPEGAARVVERVRRDHPEESFTISLRTGWDPQGMEPDVIRREYDEFEAAGIQHVVSAPWRNDSDELDAVDGAPRRARARARLSWLVSPGSPTPGPAPQPALNASMSLVAFGDRRGAVDVGDRAVAAWLPSTVSFTPRGLPDGQFGTL